MSDMGLSIAASGLAADTAQTRAPMTASVTASRVRAVSGDKLCVTISSRVGMRMMTVSTMTTIGRNRRTSAAKAWYSRRFTAGAPASSAAA